MAKIEFTALGASVTYELCDKGKREELRINGEIITDAWGDVGAWGADYHAAISGLHGAAKDAATCKYLRTRAEHLIISELFIQREIIKDLSSN